MSKIIDKILQDFKRSNSAAKQKMAERFGFESAEELLKHLTEELGEKAKKLLQDVKTSVKKGTRKKEPITVHNVQILDASSSMSGVKMAAALEGINADIASMVNDKSTKITGTIVSFSYHYDIITHFWKADLGNIDKFATPVRGSTALLETIGITLSKLLSEHNKTDKVLVKIFTDGQENDTRPTSEWYNPKNVAKLIEECQSKGFTVTFVGTQVDVNYVTNLLKIDKTNTLVHDNTREGLERSFVDSIASTVRYRKAAADGLDVSIGFYTKESGTL